MAEINRFFLNKRTESIDTNQHSNALFTILEAIKSYKNSENFEIAGILSYLSSADTHHIDGRSRQKNSFSMREVTIAHTYLKEQSVSAMMRYLNYRYQFNEYPKTQRLPAFPLVLAVEPTSICNLKCTMCYQSDDSFRKDKSIMGLMDFELFKKIIDEGAEAGVCSLVLAARGEPLLHPKFVDMIKYAKDKGILEVKINTNATKLTAKKSAELLDSGLDILVFSVDSYVKDRYEKIRVNSDFDLVLANIREFTRQKNERKTNLKTRINMLLIDPLDSPEEAEKFWSEYVDEFAVGKILPVLDIYNHSEVTDTTPCAHLWERVYIWQDGTLNPCEQDYKSTLSKWSVRDQSIRSIWMDPKYQAYRDAHFSGKKNSLSPCNRCHGI
jgi:sulfatase maturation enzyme AslB (radical SAM superfamily)